MAKTAGSVDEYLAQVTPERRATLERVRATILKHLPAGYEEGIQYGMIGYYVPHSVYPAGYHADPRQPVPFAALAAQKSTLSLYLMGVYADPELDAWLRESWAATGKKLNMGKSCIRFQKIDDLPLDVLGEAIERQPVAKFLNAYQAGTGSGKHPSSGSETGGSRAAPARSKSADKPVRKHRAVTKHHQAEHAKSDGATPAQLKRPAVKKQVSATKLEHKHKKKHLP